MATCPNINLDSWKTLVAARGEDMAYYLWDKHQGSVPSSEYVEEIPQEVKPGVEELFQENPELANAVYEAAGFNIQDNSIKDLTFELIDSDNQHDYFKIFYKGKDLTTDDKVTTGEITLALHNQGYIDAIEIPTELRNKGLGKSIYRKVNLELLNGELKSDSLGRISEDAKRVWESLVKSGEAIKTTTGYKFKETQVTPQQKQQALQLYSQYLDQIFPESKVKDIVYHGTSGFPFEKFSKEFIGKSRNAITSLEKGFYFTNNKKLSKLTAREFLDDSIIVDGKYEFAVDVFTDYAFKSESEISKIVGYDVFLKKYEINTVQDYLKKTYPNKDYKLEYYKPTPGFNKGIASVVLDIKEPTVKDLKGERILDAIPTEKEYRKIIEENDDSIIFENVVDTTRGTKEEYLGNTYVVFEPEQIHILGNKQDIEGFKQFVSRAASIEGDVPMMLQLEGKLETSVVSPETLSVIKDFLKRIGVDIKILQEIVVGGVKQDANGAAAIIQKLVMVVEGKENIALPEEAMHFAVELIEQRDPALFKKLMKEINSYRMYNAVVADYGKLKEYQTADGKPDIRKLKKEAIAKVLTEVVIKKNEGFTEKPENLARVQSWWQEIINFFKGLFSTSGFDKAAMMVLKGEALGTVEDIRLDDEIYLQSSLTPQQRIVDKIRSISAMIEKPKSEKESYKINGKPIKNRVTNISKNWLQNRFDDKQLTKDDFDKAVDDLLKEKGTMLHGEHDWMLKNHFLDSEGKFIKDATKRPNDDNYVSQLSPLDKTFYEQLKKSMEDRLSEFYEKDPNTIFLAETTVYDPKRDLAGTIDFIAVESSGKTHILDWKFKRISNVELQDDIPWYDVISWRTQMKNYKSILSSAYGVTFDGSEQTRMVPFRAIYTKADKKKNIKPQLIGLEIGAVDPKKEERSYLVPVGLEEERTGVKRIDSLIEKLNEIYEIISSKKASPEKKKEKAEQLNALYKAIRQLKMRQNLKPLIQQAGVINKSVNSLIDEYYNYWDGKEPSNFTEDERNDFSARINDFEKSLIVYSTLYKELRPLFQGELSEEEKAIKEELRDVTEDANELQIRLGEVKEKFGEGIIAKSVNILEYLKPEKIVKGISKWFGTTSTLQIKSVQVLFKMAGNAYSRAAMDTQSEGQLLLDIKSRYDKWAKTKGLTNKNYFDIIKKKPGYNKEAVEDKRKEALDDLALRKPMFTDEEYKKEKDRLNEKYDKELKGKNELIDEYNPKFYNTLRKSVKDRDFEWIKKNVDVDAYKEHLKRKKEEEINRANNKTRHGSEFSINKQKADDIAKIEMLYDTTSAEGLGWLQYDEIKKFPISDWKSDEWKELYKKDGSGNYVNAPAVEFYEYIKNRNEFFEDIGYISPKQERTFLPYVRKSLMEKIVMGGNVKLFEGVLRSISVDEGDVGYGQIDPITKQPIHTIPKYFTRDTGEEMSNDLFKNLTLINEAAIRYKYLSAVENQIHLIASIESSKKAIKTSYFGKTKMSADGEPELTNDNTENTQLFRDMMEAVVYGHKYVENQNFDQLIGGLGNFGKRANEKLGMKIFPEEFNNSQISLNKSLDWLNNAFQLKALGLNPLSSIATYLGGSFQSYINAGKYFTKTEFAKNEFLLAQRMHGVDAKKYIGALQYFLPLTENNNIMMAKKLSLSKLSQEGVQDALMFLMRKADQTVQTVNFFSFLDNTIVLDGQLVNVREYLRSTPEYSNIYSLSGKERRDKDAKFEEAVKSLIAEKGVFNVAEVKGDEFIIPGVDRKSDSVVNLRRKVQGITKDALGNLSPEDVRLINLNIYGKSFMMFKNWIPRLVDVRMGNLKYNSSTDAYEWGRTRMMMRWLMDEKLRVFKTLKGAITGDTEVFVQQMKELYERKKADYEKDTGKTLMMTEDEFVQLAAQNIRNQMVDFLFYLALTGLWFAAKGLKGDGDDKDRLTRNRYNYMLRAIDKVRDEVAFFYDPTQALSLSKSGIFPSLSLIDNYIKLFSNFANEMYALSIDDEKEADKNYVIKYLLKGFPVTSQFDAIFLTFYPDLAKDLGIKSQTEARPVGR